MAKDWSFSISPSNEYSGLIYFRIDRLHLLAVQGTLKSLLQHYSSKSSILQCSAFFMVQLSHQYMTTGRNIKRSLAQKRVQMVSGLHCLLYDFRQLTLNFFTCIRNVIQGFVRQMYGKHLAQFMAHSQYSSLIIVIIVGIKNSCPRS